MVTKRLIGTKEKDRTMRHIVFALAASLAATTLAAEKHWNPQNASDVWSGKNWNDGALFESGDSAMFDTLYQPAAASYGVTLDGDVVADKIAASVDTTVTGLSTPVAYKYFRFKVEARRDGASDMMQIAELKLYSGDTYITGEKTAVHCDSTTKTSGNQT